MFSNCKRLETAYMKVCCNGYALGLGRSGGDKDIPSSVLTSKNQFPAMP